MRTLLSLSIVAALGATAGAQPGQTQPAPQPYPPPQPPAPQPPYGPAPQPYYPPPPYYQAPPLTAEEHRLLERGEISDGAHIGGGLANFFIGFGVGQAIQGRWLEKGWIFTAGEGLSFAVLMVGLVDTLEDCFESDCDDDDHVSGYLWAGLIGYSVFHVWSIIDAFAAPPAHNARVRSLKARLGMPRYAPYVAPPREGDGGVAGLTIRF